MNTHLFTSRVVSRRGTLTAVVAAVVSVTGLSGCGGGKINGNSFPVSPAVAPIAYGLEAYQTLALGDPRGVSGLTNVDGSVGYAASATSLTYVVGGTTFNYADVGAETDPAPDLTLPGLGFVTGFGPNGRANSGGFLGATPTAVGGSATPVVFRATISNGQDGKGNAVPIDPAQVVLTSSDAQAPAFSQALSFTGVVSTVLPNATYATGTFSLPFTTSGYHTFDLNVTDVSGQKSTTGYRVLTVAPDQVCVIFQVRSRESATGTTTARRGTVTVDTPAPNVTGFASASSTADTRGTAILFTTPGTHTFTGTLVRGGATYTGSITLNDLVGGQTYNTEADPASTSGGLRAQRLVLTRQ